ncbi:MAG: hypothetical protein ACTSQE_07910 [Candidatus Heimdallarchaeaceae archaeon]
MGLLVPLERKHPLFPASVAQVQSTTSNGTINDAVSLDRPECMILVQIKIV